MSLINEALKRVDTRRPGTRRDGQRPAGMKATYGRLPPGGGSRRLALRAQSVILLVAVVLMTVLAGLWAINPGIGKLLRWVSRAEGGPRSPGADAGRVEAAPPEQPPGRHPAALEADIALRKTLQELKYYRPPASAPAEAQTAPTPPRQPPAADEGPRSATVAGNRQPPPPATVAGGCVVATGPRAASAANRPADPSPPTRTPPARRFRLTGIVRGRAGPVAIINGLYLEAGDVIDDALILRIDRHTVLIERHGIRTRLRM